MHFFCKNSLITFRMHHVSVNGYITYNQLSLKECPTNRRSDYILQYTDIISHLTINDLEMCVD